MVATKAIPQITMHLNGVIQPVTLTEHEWVTIQLPAANLGPDVTQNSATTDAERKAEDEEGNDLMDEVDRFLDDNDAEDEEDTPGWEFEEGESSQKIQIMSFVQLLTAGSCFTYSQSTSASTKFFWNMDQQGFQQKKFALMLSWKCTSSVISEALVKSGHTCGHPDISQKFGNFGLSHHCHGSLSSKQS